MLRWLPLIICAVVFFGLGFLFSERHLLFVEYTKSNTNALSRSFLERSRMYILLKSNDAEKLGQLLEALLYGDLAAMHAVDFSNGTNAALFCDQLKELASTPQTPATYSADVSSLLQKCG